MFIFPQRSNTKKYFVHKAVALVMKMKNPLTLFLLCFLGCKSGSNEKLEKLEKFDKVKWANGDGQHYPYRDAMLKDLMTNYVLPGVKRDSVLNMLGTATRVDNNYLFYRIAQERLGFFPIHTKSLVIKFAGDSTIEWVRIHE